METLSHSLTLSLPLNIPVPSPFLSHSVLFSCLSFFSLHPSSFLYLSFFLILHILFTRCQPPGNLGPTLLTPTLSPYTHTHTHTHRPQPTQKHTHNHSSPISPIAS